MVGPIRLTPKQRDAMVWLGDPATFVTEMMLQELASLGIVDNGQREIHGGRQADRWALAGPEQLTRPQAGKLNHVGFTSSFKAGERKKITQLVEPLHHWPGFTGRAPGSPSRWSTRRSNEWEPLRPKLVVEVKYDHFTGERFRHGTRRQMNAGQSFRSGGYHRPNFLC